MMQTCLNFPFQTGVVSNVAISPMTNSKITISENEEKN